LTWIASGWTSRTAQILIPIDKKTTTTASGAVPSRTTIEFEA